MAGVDGCPAGWIVVMRPVGDPSGSVVHLVTSFGDVLDVASRAAVIGVDMPIGLAETVGIGGRLADIEARSKLGRRRSAVFAVPSRAAVMETDYRRACAIALTTSEPPRKVSRQCFNLFARIREIDALMSPDLQGRVLECHPELCFWALNGDQPLAEPKKLKSRSHEPGLALRRGLLAAAGFGPAALDLPAHVRRAQAGPDDLLDACACAASAARIAIGQGRRFPSSPPVDARGLRMEIWC